MSAKYFRACFLILIAVCVIAAISSFFLQYQATCYFILNTIGKPDKIKELQSGFLTTREFFLFKIISCFIFLFLALISFHLSRQKGAIFNFCSFIYKRIKENIRNILLYHKCLDKEIKILLLC